MVNRKIIGASAIILIVVISALTYWYGVRPGIDLQEQLEREWRETITVGMGLEPDFLDPVQAKGLTAGVIYSQLYDGLTKFNGTTNDIIGDLAESWDISADKLVFTFSLRQGVKFHDGTPVNAEAVKFSYDRCLDVGEGKGRENYAALERLESITVVDTYTIRLTLEQVRPSFWYDLADYTMQIIMSPTYVEAHEVGGDGAAAWMYDHECGSGPYELVDWIPQVRVELKKFDDYWEGWDKPHIEKAIYQLILEETSQKMMMEKGDIDYAEKTMSEDWVGLDALENVEVTVHGGGGMFPCYIRPNTIDGPTADINVRRAIAYGIDYDEVIEALAPYFPRIYQHFYVPWYGEIPGLTKYERDLTKARQFLEDAGYPPGEGPSVRLMWLSGRPDQRKMADVIKGDLAEIGIDVTIEQAIISIYLGNILAPGGFDLVLMRSSSLDPDPTIRTYAYYHSSPLGGTFNFQYNNSVIDQLLDDQLLETDYPTRLEMAFETERTMVDDVGIIYIADYPWAVVISTELHGFVFHPVTTRMLNLHEMWKERS